MRRTLLKVLVLVSTFPSIACSTGWANADGLGKSQFANSCNVDVQPYFQEAVLLLHSMEFQQAETDFRRAEANDPRCVVAAWGLALAETERLGANARKPALEQGWKELQPWLNSPAGSEREQMYVDAVRDMYEGYQTIPGAIRWQRYLTAMDAIRKKYPADVNASLFYAIGLVWTAGPGQQGEARRKEALKILLPIFSEYPENPGAAHYIIHAADTPELASIALPAAREYASIAPDSPHALHMPSHIFNRLGDWANSIRANEASAKVAEKWIREGRGGIFDEQHALNNLEYAYLQLGETKEAEGIIARIDDLAKTPDGDPWGPIDARIYFDVETGDWQDALGLQPPANSPFQENFDVYWIDTIAEARLGQPAAARTSLEEFRKSSAKWIEGHGWGDVLHLALAQAQAWTLYAEGHKDDAVHELSQAVSFEHTHPVYYADVLPRPSSDMLGDMLLQMGRSREACAAFQAALNMAPNTFDSLQGRHTCRTRSDVR